MSTTVKSRPRPTGQPRIEPKLQARRIEVARHQGRRRLRTVLVILVLVAVVVGAFVAVQSPLLDVDQVVVTGAPHTGAAAIRRASGIPVGQAMASVDAGTAAARLERLPWVEQATVARSWPGTVRITVVERSPLAIIGEGADAALVDAHGRVLGPAAKEHLPVIGGSPVNAGAEVPSQRRLVLAVLAGMPPKLRKEVAGAHATASGIALTLTDGIRVDWGSISQSTAKNDALTVLLKQADRPTIATIDVSVPRAATITRR